MNQLPMLHKEWAEQTGGQGILVVVGRNSRRGGVVASWISYFRNLSRYRHITFLENVHIKQKKKEALRSPPAPHHDLVFPNLEFLQRLLSRHPYRIPGHVEDLAGLFVNEVVMGLDI